MKPIQPVQIWYNGEEKEAEVLNVYIVFDNLQNTATFQYQLISVFTDPDGIVYNNVIVQSNIAMTGQDYIDWDDSTDAAYQWVATQLNLTIV
jgi:hypothetical protein